MYNLSRRRATPIQPVWDILSQHQTVSEAFKALDDLLPSVLWEYAVIKDNQKVFENDES